MIFKVLPRRTQFLVAFVLLMTFSPGLCIWSKPSTALADKLVGLETKTLPVEAGRLPKDALVSSVDRRSEAESLDGPPLVRMDVRFTVRDFPTPGVFQTGPMNWIARNPRNPAEVFASTITGGLWKSTNGGNEWAPVRTLRSWKVSAVAYLFDDTPGGAILVTTQDDFRFDTDAGVWRSDNHGASWHRVGQVPSGCSGPRRAHGIAVKDTLVWVATSCGVLASADEGRTFEVIDDRVFPRGAFSDPACALSCKIFLSVAISNDGNVLLGGYAGFFHGFGRAVAPAGSRMMGDEGFMRRAFAVTPSRKLPNFVLAVNGTAGSQTMLMSMNHGRSWQSVPSISPGRPGAGGSPFIRMFPTAPGSDDLLIYYGDTYQIFRAGPFPGGDLSSLAGTSVRWTPVGINFHPDPHDIDLVAPPDLPGPSHKFLLATDGGMEICDVEPLRCPDSGKIGTERGLSAIQVMKVNGQVIGSGEAAVRRLYFDTWHTDKWALGESGVWKRVPGESSWLEMEPKVSSSTDSQIVYNANSLPNILSNDLMTVPDPAEDPSMAFRDVANAITPPVMLQKGIFVETANSASSTTIFATPNLSQRTITTPRWQFVADLRTCPPPATCPLSTNDAPVLGGYLGPEKTNVVLYQPHNSGLAVVSGIVGRSRGVPTLTSSFVRYAFMRWHAPNDVLQGINWSNQKSPVIGPDPLSPQHLVIPDVINDKVMRSTNGGDDWTPIVDLTEMVTRDFRLRSVSPDFVFKINKGRGQESIVSSVSFFPDNPNFVIVATVENGLFFSQDRASTWQRIPDSEHITNVVSLYWRSANSVIVGSFGRGLFEIGIRYTLPRALVDPICRSCLFESAGHFARLDSPSFVDASAQLDPRQENFDEAVLVLDGRINGIEMSQGRLQKLSVTIGSSEYRFGGPNPKLDFVTDEHTGFLGFKGLPAADQLRNSGKVVKGLTFTNGRISHVIYGSEETPMPPPTALGPVTLPKAVYPDLKDPYLRIFGPTMIRGRTAGGQSFDLQGYLFQSNATVDVLVDNQAKDKIRTTANGQFTTRLTSPSALGPHQVVVHQSIGNRSVQATIVFGVTNSEGKRRKP
jgi:hypothetical protein